MKVKLFKVQNGRYKNQCYLVSRGHYGILVDPAWEYYEISNYLREHNIKLTAVLLTHHHADHTDLADTFGRQYDIPVYMSKEEIDYYKYECSNLKNIGSQVPFTSGGINILPIVTPGHTFGSTCYLIENNLFTGDTVFMEGVGLIARSGGNADSLYGSVQTIKKYVNDKTRIWPGHSYGMLPGQPYDTLLNTNVYFHFSRNEFVNFRTRSGQTKLYDFK